MQQLAQARKWIESGRIELAQPFLTQLLSANPSDSDALLLQGIVFARQARFANSQAALEQVLAERPADYEALSWLGLVLHSCGKKLDAIPVIGRALAIEGADPSLWTYLGLCHLDLGHATQAIDAFQHAITLAPRAAQCHFNLGMALRLSNRGQQALEAFLEALRLAPEQPQNHLQVFRQLQQLARDEEGIPYLRKGVLLHPKDKQLSEALAMALAHSGREDEARQLFDKLARTDPSAARSYAEWLQESGAFEDSVKQLELSIRLQPMQGAAYRLLAEAKRFQLGESPLLEIVTALLASEKLERREQMHLAYAAAKCHERSGEYRAAMRMYDRANELAYSTYPACGTFSAEECGKEQEGVCKLYNAQVLEELRAAGNSTEQPVFIVGMIRSGTTLLDQIIASHPEVASAGELPFWNAEGDAVHRAWHASGPDPSLLGDMAERYLSVLRRRNPGSVRITDKMPLNYRHLGLIHACFPQSKIVHIRRNPIDTCLSIYCTFFGGGPNFTYRQENIAAFYRVYQQYMAHWREVLPSDRFHEIDYEALVQDRESVTRQVIGFLGLDWSEACLHHEASATQVSTPSRWQVRQPVYATSVGRWRNYEPWLGCLKDLE